MAERRTSLKKQSEDERRRAEALARRRSELALMAHRCRGAMAGKGRVALKLKSGAELAGVPTMMRIDKSLEGRAANLMVYMQGFSFPLDDVVVCR